MTRRRWRHSAVIAAIGVTLSCVTGREALAQAKVFSTPEEAVAALKSAAKASDIAPLLALLGPEGRELAATSDAATARANRDVFLVAMAEGWHLEDVEKDRKELVVGHEAWPFPVPIVRTARGWQFDSAAGKEEVIRRRIGRNELAVMRIVRTYVTAQRQYARDGHDGKPAGLYARRITSEAGTQNGLYWPDVPGRPRSPFGPLVAEAAAEGRTLGQPNAKPVPFHGYYYRIVERQGPSAPGGARDYLVNGALSGGFALIAWPAEYDATGIMTFIVNQDGIVFERDLGPGTTKAAAAITAFDPDRTWQRVVSNDAASR